MLHYNKRNYDQSLILEVASSRIICFIFEYKKAVYLYTKKSCGKKNYGDSRALLAADQKRRKGRSCHPHVMTPRHSNSTGFALACRARKSLTSTCPGAEEMQREVQLAGLRGPHMAVTSLSSPPATSTEYTSVVSDQILLPQLSNAESVRNNNAVLLDQDVKQHGSAFHHAKSGCLLLLQGSRVHTICSR